MEEPRTIDTSGPPTDPPPSPPPPTGPGKKALLLPIIVGTLLLAVGVQWGVPIKAVSVDLWHVVFGEEDSAAGDGRYYTCGMHPWVILPKPGDCPICHMKLEPIDPAKFTGEVSIDPIVAQNIGVRVSPVQSMPLTMTIRTVGAVSYDETRVRDINTKVSGWIERLHVDWLGAPVKKGEPLVDMYSPALYAAQGELLSALKGGGGSLAEAARTRLRYLDVTDAQIAELEAAGHASKAVTLMSPFEGLVVEKHANEGMAFEPGMQLYRIADLSKVWVMVTLYEAQLPFVKLGARASMTLPYGGIEREGRVAYIYPTVNTRTREVQVRLEFDNPDLALKPGMFAAVTVENTLVGDRVVVPRAAVIDTGMRKIAFVSLGEGKFEPRDVETGVETDRGVLEVTKGLEPGEQVVTSGQFLLDSEAKMREALARMMKGDLASEQKPAALVAGASELSELPPDAGKALGEMLDAYFAMADALASDSADTVGGAGRRLGAAAAALAETSIPDKPHFWHQHTEIADVRRLAGELAKGPGIVDARGHVAELSAAMGAVLRATGVPPGYGKEVQELHCPMYQDGSTWLQAGGGARNPYYGSKMLTCSDARTTLPVTGVAPAAAVGKGATGAGGDKGGVGDAVVVEPPSPGGTQAGAQGTDEHAGHGGMTPEEMAGMAGRAPVSSALQGAIDAGFTAYLKLTDALASDSAEGLTATLATLQATATALVESGDEGLRGLGQRLARAAIVGAPTIEGVRAILKELSDTMIALADAAPPGAAVAATMRVARCPMVKADWLQTADKVRNPYYGSEMLTCGSILRSIPASGTEGAQP